jgi:hypothetical protein
MRKEVEILSLVRKYIEDDQVSYLCIGIMQVTPRHYMYIDAARCLLDYIDDALCPFHTLEEWLQFNGKIPKRQLTKKNLKAYRLRYIDHLIEEFQ